jgi:uncharacterized protein (UPF0276 family)
VNNGLNRSPSPIPAIAGIGLRGPHHRDFLEGTPAVGWLEAHSENYFAEDGVAVATLEKIRRDYPLSLHGVGLSLGSSDELNETHLKKLRALIRRMEPALVSEHLSWSSVDGRFLNDLLPLPYTQEAAAHVAERIERTQEFLQRQILIENVSGYVEYASSEMPEWEFLVEVTRRAGAKILLDVNNIFVNAENHGFDPRDYVGCIPPELVGEIHLAGHSTQIFDDRKILVDTHDAPIRQEVWDLYRATLETVGAKPTLIEWDSKLPSVEALIGQAEIAQQLLEHKHGIAA